MASIVFAPLLPDDDTARQWANDELAKGKYDDSPSILERIIGWIGQTLQKLFSAPDGGFSIARFLVFLGIVALALVGVVMLIRMFKPAATLKRTISTPLQPLFDDTASARDLFQATQDAEDSGFLTRAVIERYRGTIRLLDESGYITATPGMTATEAAKAASASLANAQLFAACAHHFNSLFYGEKTATAQMVADTRKLMRICQSLPPQRAHMKNELIACG